MVYGKDTFFAVLQPAGADVQTGKSRLAESYCAKREPFRSPAQKQRNVTEQHAQNYRAGWGGTGSLCYDHKRREVSGIKKAVEALEKALDPMAKQKFTGEYKGFNIAISKILIANNWQSI